ncbi:hypothetical protein LIER_35763 [Lithospermum erythrorhizon]|uniref:Ubiquitin-like protease family profile domain-containing protein n=1 Tax=Lithospermum erythrorhizon TaxID=34254 RepID=A0AAV3NX71_LITER
MKASQHKTILRYPEILGVDGIDQISEPIADDPGNDNELSPTQEAILKFPEFLELTHQLHDDVDYKEIDVAVNTACSLGSFGISELNDGDYVVMHDMNTETIIDIPETMQLAEEMEIKNIETQELISDNPDLLGVDESKTVTIEEWISKAVTDDPINDKQLTPIFKSEEFSGFDTPIALNVTPLKIWKPGTRIINLDDDDGDDVKIEKKNKKRKHPMLYSQGTYPDRRRPIKKSKYLLSPYDDDVYESNASKLQKDIATYAWAFDEVHKDELMYISDDTSHNYSLHIFDMWTLQKDEWLSSFFIHDWINCLNWKQPNDNRSRVFTPILNYTDMIGLDVNDTISAAECLKRFMERFKGFNYMNFRSIDPTNIDYIMAPAIVGKPGAHYVCFVVNLKEQKYEFLNSLVGAKLYTKNRHPTLYKKLFEIWVKKVKYYVTRLFKSKNIAKPYSWDNFSWEVPKMPNQPDKNSRGVFCMKFLEEWEGSNIEMPSFTKWRTLRKNAKMAKSMDFRVELCAEILNDSSNSKRKHVVEKATSHCEAIAEKLYKDVVERGNSS